eukprot:3228945-Rhodomonas_salina.2
MLTLPFGFQTPSAVGKTGFSCREPTRGAVYSLTECGAICRTDTAYDAAFIQYAVRSALLTTAYDATAMAYAAAICTLP